VAKQDSKVIEQGEIAFVYRPRVGEHSPHDVDDLQRTHILLHPDQEDVYRVITIGRKRLPEHEGGEAERNWAYVDLVRKDAESLEKELREQRYQTRTRGERVLPAVRPAGEGRYALIMRGPNTRLYYALKLPEQIGEVQEQLGIKKTGSMVISVKNPEASGPPGTGLDPEQTPDLPQELQDRFRGRRFIPADPPSLLNYEGVELILIGAGDEIPEELKEQFTEDEADAAELPALEELKLDSPDHPTKPLFSGEWE
jgi:hypothetical protein